MYSDLYDLKKIYYLLSVIKEKLNIICTRIWSIKTGKSYLYSYSAKDLNPYDILIGLLSSKHCSLEEKVY